MAEPLSVVVITLNAERQLANCLASVAFADELLVVDSGSTDATLDIAKRHGARVLHQPWLGFGKQKNYAVTQARHRWVLCLDADERISEALRDSIRAALANPQFQAYEMPRRNRFMGRWLRHGEGYPDRSVRLFDRERAQWSNDAVHEKVIVRGSTGRLAGDILHESEAGLADYIDKQNRYTTLAAETLHRRGTHAGLMRLLVSPFFRFMKLYFFRLGFLDGFAGLVHIAIGCFNSFVKYAKLRELNSRAS